MILKHPKRGKTTHFDAKLAAYTLAGAAVLAVPGTAKADIIYTPDVDVMVTQPGSFAFNLSGPSSADITISADLGPSISGPPPDFANNIRAATSSGAQVVMSSVDTSDVAALAFGTLIDPTVSTNWGTGGKMIGYDNGAMLLDGFWPSDGSSAYLGFYFVASGTPFAGWADIATTANTNTSSFEVLSYAYQNTPNTAIAAGDFGQAPEPSSMALIALGAAGLIALRRRRARNA